MGTLAEANILFADLSPELLDPDEAADKFGWKLYTDVLGNVTIKE